MAKKRRQRPLPIPPRPRRRPWSREFRLQLAVVVGFVALLIGIAAGYGYFLFQDWYEENVQRPSSDAVKVGDTSFNLDYFARRLKLLVTDYGLQSSQADTAITTMVAWLEQEELLRQRAPADLGVSATPEEIELEISDRLGLSQSDPQAFEAAYKQELKRTDLSDEEYREIIEADLLSGKAQQVLSLSVPDTVEQVRMQQIVVGTEEEATSVLERLDAGEDFGDLAREFSTDEDTEEEGGEEEEEDGEGSWVARDELDLSYAVEVFALEVGAPSQPIPGPGGYLIFEVEEKQADREVTDEQRTTISSSYFSLWLSEQRTLLALPDFQPISLDADELQWAAEKAFDL